jgi:hypothetical protein
MSGRLLPAAIQAPGFQGLNSQDSEVTLESGYATSATNCIIDRFGRLGSRRGWQFLTTNNGSNWIEINVSWVCIKSGRTTPEYLGLYISAIY